MSFLVSFLRSAFQQMMQGRHPQETSTRQPIAASYPKVNVISATKLSADGFWQTSALGLSLRRLDPHDDRIVAHITFENRLGLPEIYNSRIVEDTGSDGDIVVFIHDDVWINDNFFVDRVIEGLRRFDVIGVAGNRRRVHGPAWAFVDTDLTWDDTDNLTGSIGSGNAPFSPILYFGYAPAECQLLDGVFLAARRSTLLKHGTSFDPRFHFHFYDLDFCRSSKRKGLRLGTWPISLTHQKTVGGFGTAEWLHAYDVYIEKWGR